MGRRGDPHIGSWPKASTQLFSILPLEVVRMEYVSPSMSRQARRASFASTGKIRMSTTLSTGSGHATGSSSQILKILLGFRLSIGAISPEMSLPR